MNYLEQKPTPSRPQNKSFFYENEMILNESKIIFNID